MSILTPKSISGFPEWLPEEKIVEQRLLDIIRTNFERYGFSPIETSAVERREVLTAKGGNDKEIYGLTRITAEEGDESRELALHFDLTVPLARFVAQNYGKLSFPFRRSQIQKVWRGERPQSGRYREFYQCDIDVIGDGELSLFTDAEIPSIIYGIFRAMNIGPFVIRINNRKILQGYLESLGISNEHRVDTLRIIDKLERFGVKRVTDELMEKGISKEKAQKLIEFVSLDYANSEIIELLEKLSINQTFELGTQELKTVVRHMNVLNVPEEYYRVCVGIARGLDYYTGTIYETILVNHPGIGSICSGGRYDDLASYFCEKRLPGVGISIGLTRLFPRLVQAGILQVGPATTAPVLITSLDQMYMEEYLRIATELREKSINTEVYFEPKKLGAQLKYANRKGFALAIIAGSNEFNNRTLKVKNLKTGEEMIVSRSFIREEVEKQIITLQKQNLWT